jgi:hypothetical protein
LGLSYHHRIGLNLKQGIQFMSISLTCALPAEQPRPETKDGRCKYRTNGHAARRGGLIWLVVAVALTLPASLMAAEKPDFTAGDSIPDNAPHDWNLGPTGARGWMYSNNLTTLDARQIRITKVADGSPADGVLQVGDVILGVDGERFSGDPRVAFGRAITQAETKAGGGKLSLIRWRDGETKTVVLELPVLGSYSDTAPYACAKSERILEQGCEALAQRMAKPGYAKRHNAITRSLNAMALLASGDEQYLPLVEEEAKWASQFSAGGRRTWWYGYTMMFLAEYVLETGDESVMPGLRRLALASARGQSMVGSWGHSFARPSGHAPGYGMMNAAGLPLTISLVLAREAGVDDPEVTRAIDRSAKLLRFYAGKGSIPYGDHRPWLNTHENNGKNGMAAVLFDLLGEQRAAAFFSRMCVAAHGSVRDTGHTGNFFNIAWAMPGVARSGPQATGAWMDEYGAWYFDLARRWNGTFPHQGPPKKRGDSYRGWDCTGAYLLAYAMPRQELYLTGDQPSSAPQVDADTAQQLIRDGQGWNRKDRLSAWQKLRKNELLQRLGSWSPIVRNRAAKVLARRDEAPVSTLVRMLKTGRGEWRLGACRALAKLGGQAAPAVPALRQALRDDRLWLRIRAAEALAAIGEPAMKALPRMLKMVARGPTTDDPRNMQQRYLSFAVFGKMLNNSLHGVDRELLREAIRAGLENPDGRARGAVANVYHQLTFEEIEPLLPAIHEAIIERAPSGVMFADGVRIAGLKLLAKHRIREGLPRCLDLMNEDRWGRHHRIKAGFDILEKYGGAARPMLSKLRAFEEKLRNDWDREKLAKRLEKLIKKIESASETPDLRSLENL